MQAFPLGFAGVPRFARWRGPLHTIPRQLIQTVPRQLIQSALGAAGMRLVRTTRHKTLIDFIRSRGIDLVLHGGEVLGIVGVAGNGQGELLEALAGMRAPDAGEIRLHGRTVFPGGDFDPATLRRLGLAHVPEDRLRP